MAKVWVDRGVKLQIFHRGDIPWFFRRVKNAFWGVKTANFSLIPFKIDIYTKILTQGHENRRGPIHKNPFHNFQIWKRP